jgi:hypothetical protein
MNSIVNVTGLFLRTVQVVLYKYYKWSTRTSSQLYHTLISTVRDSRHATVDVYSMRTHQPSLQQQATSTSTCISTPSTCTCFRRMYCSKLNTVEATVATTTS